MRPQNNGAVILLASTDEYMDLYEQLKTDRTYGTDSEAKGD